LKTTKKDTAEALTLEWVLHVQTYKLTLDKKRCVGCQLCSLACPKEAIRAEKQSKVKDQKATKARIDFDLSKCNFCGICDVLCPYGALKVTVNGQHLLSVVDKKSFPELIRNVKMDTSKFPNDNKESEKACPLNLIKVLGRDVELDLEHCPCCRVCESRLPHGAMQVHKFMNGKITIHKDRCPEGCTDCIDVCPIDGALRLSADGKKVEVNESFCVYCGACKIVCPVDEALELERTHIEHTPVRSGAWNKALERLASPVAVTKELKTKGSLKAMESVRKRVGLKEDRDA